MKTLRVVDLFCGAGGASEALRRACQRLGVKLELVAVNHSKRAIETHRLNHPDAIHLCESIERVDPKTRVFVDPVTGRTFKNTGRLDLLIAAPECTHFSTARGGRPVNDQSRSTAWHILKWCQELYIDNVLIENVPEFRDWAPIGANNKPLKSRKGETYRAFLAALGALNDRVRDDIYNAADYGDPTTRRRLFIMANRGKRALHTPPPTHSRTGSPTLFGPVKKWRSAREDVIDWSIQSRSIFGRKKPLSPKTMARILAGLERFGGKDLQPFLVQLRGTSDEQIANSARSLDEPISTVTGSGAHHALCEPFVMPVTHGGDTSKRERSVDDPLPTITGAHRGELAVCETLILANNTNNIPKSVEEPVPTVTGANRLMKIDAFVLPQQSEGLLRSVDSPLPTISTAGAIAVVEVEPFLIQPCHGGGDARRVKSVDEPLGTVPCSNRFAVVEPFILPPLRFDLERSLPVDAPLPTVTATGGRLFGLVEPFLIPHYGERDGQTPRTHSVDDPVPTIPASGDGKFEVVQPFIVTPGGANLRQPSSVDAPLPTVTCSERFAVAEPIIASYYGTQNVTPVSDPLPTVTTKDRFALVMPVVNGRALDIRLRMLKPHELARAMSFGDDYQFAGNQGDKVKQIGNAWPCKLGQALIETLLEHYAAKRSKAGSLEAIA